MDSEKIITFSKKVDVEELLSYGKAVMESTDAFLTKLSNADIKQKFTDEDKDKLVNSSAAFCVVQVIALTS